MTKQNMNFEVIPEFPVTVQVKENFGVVMDEQDNFGFNKYGKALDHRDNYDWLGMATEEIADALKYFQCEKNRKKDVIELLEKSLIISNDTGGFVKSALKLLKTGGTGK